MDIKGSPITQKFLDLIPEKMFHSVFDTSMFLNRQVIHEMDMCLIHMGSSSS